MRLLDDEPDLPPPINILPLIDVIFAVLAFFIISSLFLSRNEGLPVNLPQAASAKVQEQAKITVTITPDGDISVNETAAELDDLQARVRQLMGESATAIVVLKADETVSHGRVVAVMDRLRQVEGAKLAIATTQPSTESDSEP